MNYFLDYLILQRRLFSSSSSEQLTTPFEIYMDSFLDEDIKKQNNLSLWKKFRQARHSIFQIIKVHDYDVTVLDLLNNIRTTVTTKSNQTFKGFNKNDILQCFVLSFEHISVFARGIVIHPKEVLSLIKKAVSKESKSENFDEFKFCSKFAAKQLRYLRYSSLDPRKVYKEGAVG
jgi:hypothetical protein